MTDQIEWDHKDEWHKRGENFLVVVKRHSVEPSSFDPDKGINRWAVYAYIYPQHKSFGEFNGPNMFQPSANALPLHGGPSLLRWHYADDGKPTSVQVGADYDHLYDDHFSHYMGDSDAGEVFEDAARLFDYLTKVDGRDK